MFGKLKLNLEDIQVESFETTEEQRAADGTVVGASSFPAWPFLSNAPDCFASCLNGSCDSCDLTDCNPVNTCTCVFTCFGSGSGTGDDGDPTCTTTNDQGTCVACC